MTPREKSTTDGNDITKKVAGTTSKKKKVVIDQNTHGYYFIKFADGGQLPKQFKGRFTKYEFAQHVVDAYVAGK